MGIAGNDWAGDDASEWLDLTALLFPAREKIWRARHV